MARFVDCILVYSLLVLMVSVQALVKSYDLGCRPTSLEGLAKDLYFLFLGPVFYEEKLISIKLKKFFFMF